MWYKYCFLFLLGRLKYPGETENKGYAKVYYGRCANGECIDNHEKKTLWIKCSRKKGAGLVNQLPQSRHFQFLSTKPFTAVGEDIENLKK